MCSSDLRPEPPPPRPTPKPEPALKPPAPPADLPRPAALGIAGSSASIGLAGAPSGPTVNPKPEPKKLKSAASIPDFDAPPPPPTAPTRPSKPVAATAPPVDGDLFARLAARPGREPSRDGGKVVLFADADAPSPARPPPPMLLEPVEEARPPATEDLVVVEAMGDDPNDPVLSVEEAEWKLELARPARLVQVGWMVSGEAIIGKIGRAHV